MKKKNKGNRKTQPEKHKAEQDRNRAICVDTACKSRERSVVLMLQASGERLGITTLLWHPKYEPTGCALSTTLTLFVKSSRTKVATLPLMPMKRFTLVRTT